MAAEAELFQSGIGGSRSCRGCGGLRRERRGARKSCNNKAGAQQRSRVPGWRNCFHSCQEYPGGTHRSKSLSEIGRGYKGVLELLGVTVFQTGFAHKFLLISVLRQVLRKDHQVGRESNHMSLWDFTPKASGPHHRQKPNLSSGKLSIIALCVVFVVLVLTIWLAPPMLR